MTAASDHYRRLVENARASGIRMDEIDLPGFGRVAVSYRRDFRWRWMATTLHVFTFVAPRPAATVPELDAFAAACADYAATSKPGLMRGLQTGSGAIPIVVMDAVPPEVRYCIGGKPTKRFAIISLPAVVDATTGEAFTAREQLVWGALYDAHLRQVLRDHVGQAAQVGPEPGSVRNMRLIYAAAAVLLALPMIFFLIIFFSRSA